MKYVLLFLGSRDQQAAWDQMSDEDRAKQYERVGRWFVENRSRLGHSNQLQGPDTATSVRFQANGEPIVHAGPFLEGNEVIGGYVEATVANLDEALRMAKTWPGGGTVEIRPAVEQR